MSAICSVAFGAAVAAGLAEGDLAAFGVGIWLAVVLIFVLDPVRRWLAAPGEQERHCVRYGVVEVATVAFIVASMLPARLVDGAFRVGAVGAVGVCNYPAR